MSSLLRPAFAAAMASALTATVAITGSAMVSEYGSIFNVVLAPFVLTVAFMVTWTHALLLGLPLYLRVPLEWRDCVWVSLCGSLLIGALPIPLLGLLPPGLGYLVNGQPVEVGVLESYLRAAVAMGACGSVGGLAFWWAIQKGKRAGRSAE